MGPDSCYIESRKQNGRGKDIVKMETDNYTNNRAVRVNAFHEKTGRCQVGSF